MSKRLSDGELEETLPGLEGWELRGDRIAKTFRFPDFVAAFGFMTRVAIVAEKRDHHPEWRNVYGTVEVELTTHDEGGITWLDVALARTMNELAGG
ncbi:MAG: 4a-hydroxytetrahydrobiopterin dehydratase [Polyangiales bacterium]